MSAVTTVAARVRGSRGGRVGPGLIVLGAAAMAAGVWVGVFGGHDKTTAAPPVDKYANTLSAVDAWWTSGLTAAQRTAYCTAYKSNPTTTVSTIQSTVDTNPAAAARFDATAVKTYFTGHCPK